MSAGVEAPPLVVAPARARHARLRLWRSPAGIIGFVLLVLVVGIAVLGPLFAPHDPSAPIGVPGSAPGGNALLGTDFLGRDVLSRVLHGGLYVLGLASGTICATYLIGIAIGMFAGMSRSWLDPVLMRGVDMFLVFPSLVLLLLLLAGAGNSIWVLLLGLTLVLFPGVARLVRTATLEVSTKPYIEVAVARGEKPMVIMRHEILPNIAPALLADLGVRFSAAIVLAASVNFLGLGQQPPAANWGLMIAENRPIIQFNLWSVLIPALLVGLLTIAVNMIGDAYVRGLGRSR